MWETLPEKGIGEKSRENTGAIKIVFVSNYDQFI